MTELTQEVITLKDKYGEIPEVSESASKLVLETSPLEGIQEIYADGEINIFSPKIGFHDGKDWALVEKDGKIIGAFYCYEAFGNWQIDACKHCGIKTLRGYGHDYNIFVDLNTMESGTVGIR